MVAPALIAGGVAGSLGASGATAASIAGGAAGGGFLSSLFSSGSGDLFKGLFGSLLGGTGGSLFGGKRTGSVQKLLEAASNAQLSGLENFERRAGRFQDAFRSSSPVYGALESRVLSDLNDENRTARLESAFQKRLQQQQASLGILRSPTSALRTSFAGLQFNEDMRQRAFDNASAFQGGIAQPLMTGFFNSGLAPISADTGFNQTALALGQNQMMRQSVVGGFNEGYNQNFNNRALSLAEQLMKLREQG